MGRSVGTSIESPASVDQILAAFADEGYWQARLAEFGNGTATLDSLSVSADGTVAVAVTLSLLRDKLPGMVTRLYRGELRMVRTEKWNRRGSRVGGELAVTVPGAPISVDAEALLVPQPNGSRLTYSATVEVKIPVVGGKIEDFIGTQFADGIPPIQRFTNEWIAENR